MAEYERSLDGVMDDEAVVRLRKADGAEMNSISWTMGHVSIGWLFASHLISGEQPDYGGRIFFGANADPTPPTLDDMEAMRARAGELLEGSLAVLSPEVLASKRETGPLADETIGTQLMRTVLHTWFHIGEINAIRQMLGHSEIDFVGAMSGQVEYGGVP